MFSVQCSLFEQVEEEALAERPAEPQPVAHQRSAVDHPRGKGPASDDAAVDLAVRLAPLLAGRRLAGLTLTANRSVALSFRLRRVDGSVVVRLQSAFADAPAAVLQAIAALVLGSSGAREARRVLRRHLQQRLPAAGARRATLRPSGRFHDLGALREELVASHFAADDGVQAVGVTWGGRGRARRRARSRSLRLGSYVRAQNIVRLHPCLDAADVPRFVVRAVLYHELLHAVLPERHGAGGRRIVHGPEFRRRERELPDLAAAESWIERHLGRLLARR